MDIVSDSCCGDLRSVCGSVCVGVCVCVCMWGVCVGWGGGWGEVGWGLHNMVKRQAMYSSRSPVAKVFGIHCYVAY